jgi:hypothetical protein
MKLLAQKLFKTELWLKRYKILKLQGLDFNYKMKTWARQEFARKPRASVQDSQNYQGIELFSQKKIDEPSA